MRKGHTWTAIITGLVVTLWAASAAAGPIHGSFSMWGEFLPVIGTTGETTLDSSGVPTFEGATGINFLNLDGTDTLGSGEFLVRSAFTRPGQTNNFAALRNTTGTIRDFSFMGPGSAAYPTLPVLQFQELQGGLTFTLQDIWVKMQDAQTLSLSGVGFFDWAGYDRTPGFFEFTGTNSGGSIAFAASEMTPVPEPASFLLMGSGALLGLRRLRRRRQGATR